MESDPSGAAATSTGIAPPNPTPPAPPAGAQELPPTYKLYKPSGVMMATFLGSPIAGLVAMALNYRRFGDRRAAWLAIAAALAYTAALIIAALTLPEDLPRPIWLGFGIGGLVAMRVIADSLQGRAVKQHVRRGGRVASLWKATGVALLTLVLVGTLVFAGAFAVLYFESSDLDHKIDYTRSEEIYYAEQATAADARKLGDLLRDIGYFGGATENTVVLRTDASGTAVSFVRGRAWDAPETVSAYQVIGHRIAAAGFRKPLTILLCDPEMTVKRTIRID